MSPPAASPPTALPALSPDVKQDIIDLAFQESHHVEMMFYPPSWANAPAMSCNWVCNDFPPNPRSSIPKQSGVYVFVVMTNLFNFSHANGLFYIGKATNLYERIGAYINDSDKRRLRSKRPLIWRMLNQWHGHLKYFYTTTTDVSEAKILEDHMLNAFQPPFNRQYDATTSPTVRAFL